MLSGGGRRVYRMRWGGRLAFLMRVCLTKYYHEPGLSDTHKVKHTCPPGMRASCTTGLNHWITTNSFHVTNFRLTYNGTWLLRNKICPNRLIASRAAMISVITSASRVMDGILHVRFEEASEVEFWSCFDKVGLDWTVFEAMSPFPDSSG